MWYRFGQVAEVSEAEISDPAEIVQNTILDWLHKNPPYDDINAGYISSTYLQTAEDEKDVSTYDLINTWIQGNLKYNPQRLNTFIAHNADHPALKNLAKEMNIRPDSSIIWTADNIRSLISEFYKIEYKIHLAKQKGSSSTADILMKRYQAITNQLADMLKDAAERWIYYHAKNWYLREQQEKSRDYRKIDKLPVVRVGDDMDWVVKEMSVPNPDPGLVSVALGMCHMGGNIIEYVPAYTDEPRGHIGRKDIHGIDDFLSEMSNEQMVPSAEKEIGHDILNDLYPKEEHSPEWLRAAKKKPRK